MTLLRYVVRGLAAIFGLLAIAAAAWHLVPADEISGTSDYLDMHVHTAGIGAGGSGCFINESMREGYKFRIYLAAFGVTLDEMESGGDVVVLEKLNDRIGASARVGQAVVLAMDGVIDTNGSLDRGQTQIYVPNDFVALATARLENLRFGASINPYRPDALERLDRAAAQGAVLVKWIPNIMHIDPADERIIPFYDRMAALKLPLLSHAGQERSFASANDEYGDPVRLSLPLSRGVTVIAAHIATTGTNQGEENFDRILPMFAKYPNLYTEVSSLTQVNKLGYLGRALGQPDLTDRMLYGSDWPLQFFPLVSPLYHLDHIDLTAARAIADLDNPWDADVALKQAMGVPDAVFERSAELLLR